MGDIIQFPFEKELERKAQAADAPAEPDAGQANPSAPPANEPDPCDMGFKAPSPVWFGMFVYMTADGKFGIHRHGQQSLGDSQMLLSRALASIHARMAAESVMATVMAASGAVPPGGRCG